MRLTLRTLLAYLDDRLTPANARELGQKLSGSPFAMELAQRIKDVVRRRRLATHAAQHKMIDPNLVAEYLDDQLTPELIALIEKEILSSDYSLAEVAATHQILGLLSDPVEIGPALQERLYQLDPTAAPADDNHVAGTAASAGNELWTPLQKPTDSQKRSPMILLAVMVLGWLVLLATDSHLFNSPGEPAVAEADDPQLDPVAPVPEDNSAATEDPTTADDNRQPENQSPIVAANDNKIPAVNSTQLEPTVPEVPVATTDPKTPDNDNSATPATPPVVADAGDSVNEPVEQKVTPVVEITENANIVFLKDQNGAWVRASSLPLDPGRNWVEPLSQNFFVVGPPFQTRLISPTSGWAVRVLGPSAIRISEREPLTLQVPEGRLLLQRFGPDLPDSSFHLSIGRATVRLPVPSEMGVLAIEVVPVPVPVSQPDPADPVPLLNAEHHCRISVTSMEADTVATVATATDGFPIPAGSTWSWSTETAATAANSKLENLVPDWALAAVATPTAIQNQLVATARATLNAGGSIIGSLQGMAGDRNPQVAIFAVQHLTLMREVDNLVALLMTSDKELPARQEAILGLNRIAITTASGPGAIRKALATRLPEMDLDDAMRLILGVTPVAAEDPQVSEWLLDMLEHSRASFRELAIFNLERLTGERNGYFATDETSRRDAAVRRWRRFVERNGGLTGGTGN